MLLYVFNVKAHEMHAHCRHKFEEMVCYSLFPKYKYVNELHFMSLILMNFLKGKQQIFLD